MKTKSSLWLLPFTVLLGCCSTWSKPDHRPVGQIEVSTAPGGARRIVLENNVGSITVAPASDEVLRARIDVFYRGGREALGRPAQPDDFRMEVAGEVVRVANAHLEESGTDDWKMDIYLLAPRAMDLQISSGVGDCLVKDFEGSIELESGVGDIEVISDRLPGARLKTGVGDVRLSIGSGIPSADVDCEAGVGDLEIELSGGFDGEVSLHAGVGSISLSGAPAIEVKGSGPQHEANGKLGGSAVKVRGKTGVGDIEFSVPEGGRRRI